MGAVYRWEMEKLKDLYLSDAPVETRRKEGNPVLIRPEYLYRYRSPEERTLNPFKRWANKFEKVLKIYTDFGKPWEMWKPLLAGAVAKMLEPLDTKPEERHGLVQDLVGGFISILRADLKQYAHNQPYIIMPALRNHISAAEGISNLKFIYTYNPPRSTKEYPIYLSGGEKPDNDLLRKNITYVDNNLRSPYEDDALDLKKRISDLFDTQDGPPVLNAATMFDYDDYFVDEPQKAYRWAVKDDSWVTQQYGERMFYMESALPPDLRGKVKIYARPVYKGGFWYILGKALGDESPRSWRMWFEWVVKRPLLYAVADFFIEPLETGLELVVPRETMRFSVFQKAKGVSGAYRGMSNPRLPYLSYN